MRMMRMIVLVAAVAMMMLSVAPDQAQAQRRGGPPPPPRTADQAVEVSATYGHMWGGHVNLYNGKLRVGTAESWGAALDVPVAKDTWLELSYTYQGTQLDLDRYAGKQNLTDMTVNYWQLGSLRGVPTGGPVMPFVFGSLGLTYYSPSESTVEVDDEMYRLESATKFSFNFGVGFKAYMGQEQKVGLRAQFKVMPTLYNAGAGFWFGSDGASVGVTGSAVWQYEVSGGLTVKFGTR